MPRIGVTGYSGMVGQELLKFPDTIPLPCDVRNYDEVEMVIRNTQVDYVVHLASISDVDECEKKSNLKLVKDTNIEGVMNVCDAAEKYDCGVLLISSAQVFDGLWGNYREKNKTSPVNMYGLTKAGAEGFLPAYNNLRIIRTSYLFSHDRLSSEVYGLRKGEYQYYPVFMERSFMYVSHFVESMYRYLLNWDDMPKLIHIAGCQSASWFGFMQDVARCFGISTDYVLARTKELDGMVRRPHKATLNVSLSKKLGFPQYSYLDGLRAMRELL